LVNPTVLACLFTVVMAGIRNGPTFYLLLPKRRRLTISDPRESNIPPFLLKGMVSPESARALKLPPDGVPGRRTFQFKEALKRAKSLTPSWFASSVFTRNASIFAIAASQFQSRLIQVAMGRFVRSG